MTVVTQRIMFGNHNEGGRQIGEIVASHRHRKRILTLPRIWAILVPEPDHLDRLQVRRFGFAAIGSTFEIGVHTRIKQQLPSQPQGTVAEGKGHRGSEIPAGGVTANKDSGRVHAHCAGIGEGPGDNGTTIADVVVQLSRSPSAAVTVQYTTADGTATSAASDYQPTAGQLTFSPGGPLVQSIVVPILGDTRHEQTESLQVQLSGATNATLLDPQGTITIEDNDELSDHLDVVSTDADGDAEDAQQSLVDREGDVAIYASDASEATVYIDGEETALSRLP